MRNNRITRTALLAILVLTCVFMNAQVLAETPVNRVEPLEQTLDIENLTDCVFNASFASPDIYLNEDGALVIHMIVYDNELFDIVDIANLAAGDILVIDGEEQTVTSIETDEYGCKLINGGYEADGWTLTTDESGVYYAIDVDDLLHYRALGEVILPVAQEFTMEDSSDLENPEKILYAGDLITDIAPYEMIYYAYNTIITVEEGFITNMKVVYVP